MVAAHAGSALVAFGTISVFWTASVMAELLFGVAEVVATKTFIAWGLLVLVPAMAATSATGFALTTSGTRRRNRTLRMKARRATVVGLVGALVLVPAAISLWWMSRDGVLETQFHIVQAIELFGGAINWALLAANIRAGRRLRARGRREPGTMGRRFWATSATRRPGAASRSVP